MMIQGFEMDLGDRFSYVCEDLRRYGVYEINSTALLNLSITKDEKCVDVGAHIGYYTLLMSRLGKRVTAFEPMDYNCELLRKNVKLNNLDNVRVENIAISDKNEVGQLVLNERCTGMNHLDGVGSKRIYNVPVNRLDTIFGDIDVLKIDVEGLETRVLRGMGDIRPRLILVEDVPVLRQKRGDDPKEMYKLLEDYSCVRADNNLLCVLK